MKIKDRPPFLDIAVTFIQNICGAPLNVTRLLILQLILAFGVHQA